VQERQATTWHTNRYRLGDSQCALLTSLYSSFSHAAKQQTALHTLSAIRMQLLPPICVHQALKRCKLCHGTGKLRSNSADIIPLR
jgi:hypothetical protein